MTVAVKTRKKSKSAVLAEINYHLLDNNKSTKNPWKLTDYAVDLYRGIAEAILEQTHYGEDSVELFSVENFPGQCGAVIFYDLLSDRRYKAPLLLEHFLRNIRTFVDKPDWGTVAFCTTMENTVVDNVIKRAWGEPFLTQRNPNTRHIINYYSKVI